MTNSFESFSREHRQTLLMGFSFVAAFVICDRGGEGWRPRHPLWNSVREVFSWSVAYLIFAIIVNTLTGPNFAYVSHPQENPSLLDHLGPWPWD